jgi:hypothetical protein
MIDDKHELIPVSIDTNTGLRNKTCNIQRKKSDKSIGPVGMKYDLLKMKKPGGPTGFLLRKVEKESSMY